MDTTSILPNFHHDHHLSTTTTTITTAKTPSKPNKATKLANPLSSKLKCVRKKKTNGKKDTRQSKIHTAQGLRDRRMRLSVHTARKFFDLNDMLGFDKASKTIEWLFNKSQEAIEEVTDQTLQSRGVSQSVSNTGTDQSAMEIIAGAAEKDDKIEDESSRKPHQEDHNMKELCFPLEYSNTYNILKQLHLDNNNNITGGSISSSTINHESIFDYTKTEPSSCWLNSRSTSFLGGWNNAENSRMASLNGNMSSNFVNFSSENRGQ